MDNLRWKKVDQRHSVSRIWGGHYFDVRLGEDQQWHVFTPKGESTESFVEKQAAKDYANKLYKQQKAAGLFNLFGNEGA
jgi:hypothetical protein